MYVLINGIECNFISFGYCCCHFCEESVGGSFAFILVIWVIFRFAPQLVSFLFLSFPFTTLIFADFLSSVLVPRSLGSVVLFLLFLSDL